GVKDCSLILGNDVLQLFPEIELDYEVRELRLKSHTTPLPDAPRNLMLNKIPYILVKLNGIPATMVWDTGASKSSVEPEFHETHRDRLPPLQAHGRKRGKTATGYSPVLEYAILPQMELTIGDKTGEMTNLYVIEDMPHSQLMGIPFDGILGALPPAEFKRLTINFQGMYFLVE
ncbi:MAG: aspartyl protease family protein, partial [Alistipes sp.]|nr:aspartyl protease family protein [Alistipes sp.]